ncbi:MAG: DUF4097 family beta strand repeat-containing protein [Bryobacteraceae bacterium]|nr:DUF4097 family beta strand repeat-containing protein [Bryobacteraceae bacterium]
MKRTSLVAPLLLILIGGLFLMNNLRPDLPLLDLLGRYWPFLLIGWGVLRLAEITFWFVQRRPLPLSGISGGEWTLVVLITVVGSSLFFAHHNNWPRATFGIRGIEVFGETYDYPVAADKPGVGKAPRIVIENLRGNVRIVGTAAEDVKLSGRKVIRAFDQAAADKANDSTPLEVTTPSANVVLIRTNQERSGGDQRISADLELSVPKGATVEARARYGDFDVADLDGGVDISSDNAGVRLQNIGGAVRLDLRKSDVVRAIKVKGNVELRARGQDIQLEDVEGQVTIAGSYSGDLELRRLAKPVKYEGAYTDFRIERIPGELRMGISELTASNLVGPVRITSSRSKDIEINEFSDALEIAIDRGDVHLRTGGGTLGKMSVKTRSGDLELALPENARFDLLATTRRGHVENDYGSPVQADNEDNDRGGKLSGKSGSGPELRLETDRGAVVLRKWDRTEPAGTALAPEPPASPDAPRKPRVESQ